MPLVALGTLGLYDECPLEYMNYFGIKKKNYFATSIFILEYKGQMCIITFSMYHLFLCNHSSIVFDVSYSVFQESSS